MSKKKNDKALRSIGEVTDLLGLAPHVIRFWESNFAILAPIKLNGRRYYSPENIEIITQIKTLLYSKNYSIKDAVSYFKQPKHPLLLIKEKLIKAQNKLFSILYSSHLESPSSNLARYALNSKKTSSKTKSISNAVPLLV